MAGPGDIARVGAPMPSSSVESSLQAQLLHLNGPYRGRTITYRPKHLHLGTAKDCNVWFPKECLVESHHAELAFVEESCSFHLKAMDGPVFVNRREVSEVILEPDDLIELGRGGPQFRFRIHAERGRACKPVYLMLRDAGEVHGASGLRASMASLQRDVFSRSTWRARLGLLVIASILVFAAAYVGGLLGGVRTAREQAELRRNQSELYDQMLTRIHSQLQELRRAQAAGASREEVERLRTEFNRRASIVDAFVARNAALRDVLEVYTRGVCLIHGVYGFLVREGEQEAEVMNPDGTPARLEYVGSGFLASHEGDVITNRHVAQPWWNDVSVAGALAMGMEPRFVSLRVHFPGRPAAEVDPSSIQIAAGDVDVAVFRVVVEDVPVLPLYEGDLKAVRGERVILLGYPTGLNALLARAEPSVASEVLAGANDMGSLIGELAKRNAISPVITQGMLNEVLDYRLVYDAETTSGGSGGPVFGSGGLVIGINFAITRDFHGSNFGVPISFARELLNRPKGSADPSTRNPLPTEAAPAQPATTRAP